MSTIATAFDFEEEAAEGIYESGQITSIRWQLYLGFIGLLLGGLVGLLQALDRLGIDAYGTARTEYYQGLTIHGVTLVLVLTFTFGNALLSLTTIKGFNRPLASTSLLNASLLVAALGVVLASVAMLNGSSSVLYTMYSPMEASVLFYTGAVLLVISTWLISANQLLTLRAWRKDNVGQRVPLMAYVSILSFLMWDIASLGIAVEALGFLIPNSLGVIDYVDPQLNRILFWFTGHAIVYFWLLPVYVSWYMILPKQIGGKLYSDGLVRLVFIMFLLFSIPTGLHHQYSDPGIPSAWKTIHLFTTFVIFFPSLVTAFTLMSTIESAGRARGGKGWFGWIRALPWGNPVVSSQLLAMLVFMLGGATGIINASYTVNKVVHNTAYIPGHFHLTVGTAVGLSIMGITYWMVPFLTGRALAFPSLAKIQPWIYAIGVLMFSIGQIQAGLRGMPRRLYISEVPYVQDDWKILNYLAGAGGVVMTVSGLLFFIVLIGTIFLSKEKTTVTDVPMAEAIHGSRQSYAIFDNIGFWVLIALILVLLAYGPVFIDYLPWNGTSIGIPV